MKKLWLMILLALCFVLPCAAEEETNVYTSGDYQYVLLDDGTAKIYKCNSMESKLAIPAEIDGYSVTTIGEDAFFYCDGTTNIIIPDSVTTIAEYAFYGCESLTSITIPDSVTTIGEEAFASCDSLVGVTIPDSVTNIGIRVFAYNDSLVSVIIPDSVTTIGEDAFFDCDGLTSIIIPDSVTTIDGGAFFECSSLTSIIIPNSVTAIGEDAFSYCDSLTEITVTRGSYAEQWFLEAGCSVKYDDEWNCIECGTINNRNFCTECGAAKPVIKTQCDSCGYLYEEGTTPKFCPECGTKQ